MSGASHSISEQNHINVRVEWSRFDKVTLKFTTVLTIMGVENRSTEFIDRRLVKQTRLLTGSVDTRCAQLAEQKTEAVTKALAQNLAVLTQARHVTAQETN